MPILLAMLMAGATAPTAARIEDVAANPATFDGRWLRLRGQIDQCTHFACAICPEDAAGVVVPGGKCLTLDWDRLDDGRHERGPDRDAMNRYASVEIVARFDTACITGICLDRAPVLFDARVEHVLKRRPSALGSNGRRAIDRMVDPPPTAAAPLIALLRRLDQVPDDAPAPPRYRVFTDSHDPELERGGIICRSRGPDGDPATWPVDEDSATFARSTEDNFQCHFARRQDGQWRIDPD